MAKPVRLEYHDDCSFAEGETPDYYMMFIVCPDTGVLIHAVKTDHWNSTVVNAATREPIDMTKISQFYGVEAEPWST